MKAIDFNGYELDVDYSEIPYEPERGLFGGVENVRAFYQGCDVTDIIYACDKMPEVTELIQNLLDEATA